MINFIKTMVERRLSIDSQSSTGSGAPFTESSKRKQANIVLKKGMLKKTAPPYQILNSTGG